VKRFLQTHRIDVFDFAKSASDIWGKERCLKSLLKSRRLRPDEVAYVGDEVRDIEATRPLSVRMVAVGWGYTAAKLLASHEPDHLIDHPEQLLAVLQAHRAPIAAKKEA
jgi:phosphoglycolate phosphatase